MFKNLARLVSAALLLAGIVFPRAANANCEYPRSQTTTFYAYVYLDSPPWCSGCPVGSPVCGGVSWHAIGQITVECDGTTTSWGDTTSCTDNANTGYTTAPCPPVCD